MHLHLIFKFKNKVFYVFDSFYSYKIILFNYTAKLRNTLYIPVSIPHLIRRPHLSIENVCATKFLPPSHGLRCRVLGQDGSVPFSSTCWYEQLA